tara:strand:- start:146 stop:997 length:852 start_codon:yes stop_codon:yes gene_type:complete
VAIRTLPSRAIADASIQAVDIANSSISKEKLDADTQLGLQQNDSIILDGTDGAGANKGDFLTLNGTDNSSTNADDRILFNDTFIDKVGLFNINTLGSGGTALKVNDAGNAFEFGTAGGLTLLSSTTLSSSSDVRIQGLMTGYDSYKCVYNIQRSTNLIIRLYFMSGASILSSGYHMTANSGHGSGITRYQDDSQGYINYTATWSANQSATTTPVNGFFYIVNPNDANDYTTVIGSQSLMSTGGNLICNTIAGSSTTAQAQDGLRFYPSTGNFANGFIKLYGIT